MFWSRELVDRTENIQCIQIPFDLWSIKSFICLWYPLNLLGSALPRRRLDHDSSKFAKWICFRMRSVHVSWVAKFRTGILGIWTIFFSKNVPFCVPSLKGSFSELRRSLDLCFGYVSDPVGGSQFFEEKMSPSSLGGVVSLTILPEKFQPKLFGEDFGNGLYRFCHRGFQTFHTFI